MNSNALLIQHLRRSVIEDLDWIPEDEQEWMIRQFMHAARWSPFATAKIAIDTLLFLVPDTPIALNRLPFLCPERKKKLAYIEAASLFIDQDVAECIRHIDETTGKNARAVEQTWAKIILYLEATTMPISSHTQDDIDDACRTYLRTHPAETPSKRADTLCILCIRITQALAANQPQVSKKTEGIHEKA